MKACHACGQKLPVRNGDIVEGKVGSGWTLRRGIVANTSDSSIVINELGTGEIVSLKRSLCTRLHGYYRITERETL